MISGMIGGMVGGMIGGLLSSAATADPTLVLNLNFLASSLPDGLTFSRASAATDIINGVLTSFASGAARISTANGYLSEPARTNLAKNNSSAATAGTLVQGATDPAGASLAYTYTETATNTGQQWSAGSATIAYVSGTTYTASAYVKAGTCDRVQMFISSFVVTTAAGYANFYLNGAGSVSLKGDGFTSASIERMGATDWYRIVATFTCDNTVSPKTLSFCTLITGSETRVPTILGTSRTVYYFGPQVEVGAFVTSYIPTTTATVTRADDVCTMATSSITGFSAAALTLYLEGLNKGYNGTFSLGSINTGGDIVDSYIYGSTTVYRRVLDNYAGTSNTATVAAGSVVKSAIAWSSGDAATCTNGGTVGTGATPAGPLTLGTLVIGNSDSGTAHLCSYVRAVKIYNVRKSNTDLQAMTT